MDETSPTVLITGVSAGIGRELAIVFAREGFRVAGCARSRVSLDDGSAIRTFVCDVTQPEAVEVMVGEVVRSLGHIDVLINNVGTLGPIGPVYEVEPEAWRSTIETNLYSTFLVTRFVLPEMIRRGQGRILNLSGASVGARPLPAYSAYACSKAAVVAFTESVAAELVDRNIQVNAIAPGFVPTRIHDATIAAGPRAGEYLERTRSLIASTNFDDAMGGVCDLALFLASTRSGGVTGRLFSAKWDDWAKMSDALNVHPESQTGTLRRIDNERYFERV